MRIRCSPGRHGHERVPRRYGGLITVAIAFLVALAVFLLLRVGFGSGILAALLAPLVVLLPGALLTTAVLELSTMVAIALGVLAGSSLSNRMRRPAL